MANCRYHLLARRVGETVVCGWLRSLGAGCILSEVNVSGVALPADATNFDDKIALLDMDVPGAPLIPGGQLPLILEWQALS